MTKKKEWNNRGTKFSEKYFVTKGYEEATDRAVSILENIKNWSDDCPFKKQAIKEIKSDT